MSGMTTARKCCMPSHLVHQLVCTSHPQAALAATALLQRSWRSCDFSAPVVCATADELSAGASSFVLSLLYFFSTAASPQPQYVNELTSSVRQSLRVRVYLVMRHKEAREIAMIIAFREHHNAVSKHGRTFSCTISASCYATHHADARSCIGLLLHCWCLPCPLLRRRCLCVQSAK